MDKCFEAEGLGDEGRDGQIGNGGPGGFWKAGCLEMGGVVPICRVLARAGGRWIEEKGRGGGLFWPTTG